MNSDVQSPIDLIIVCGGGHAREISEPIRRSAPRLNLLGYLDEKASQPGALADIPYLGNIDRAVQFADSAFVVAVGAPRVRSALVSQLTEMGIQRFAQIIHPHATVAGSHVDSHGSQICAGARISIDVRLGAHVIANQNCTIAHDCTLGDFVTVAPLAAVSGNVTIEAGAEVGTGASIRQGVRIGRGAMVGMGAVVLHDVPDHALVVGNPARLLRELDPFN